MVDGRNLELSQKAKIHHVLTAARVKPGDRILEIGSRWCGFAIEVLCSLHPFANLTTGVNKYQAATAFGCTVDTVTLSSTQKTLERRVSHHRA
jgi:cyclopropane-fatty-acyl-phospholipid synthase